MPWIMPWTTVEQPRQFPLEVLPGDATRTEARQVRRLLLAIDQWAMVPPQQTHQSNERDLGGIGARCKHRLAEEHATDGHPVQSTDQLVALPCLHGVRHSETMQVAVRGRDLAGDPRAALARPRAGASGDDAAESRIHLQLELSSPEGLA